MYIKGCFLFFAIPYLDIVEGYLNINFNQLISFKELAEDIINKAVLLQFDKLPIGLLPYINVSKGFTFANQLNPNFQAKISVKYVNVATGYIADIITNNIQAIPKRP